MSASSDSQHLSTRIKMMMQMRRDFFDQVQFEIESSKVHWSEVEPPTIALKKAVKPSQEGNSAGASSNSTNGFKLSEDALATICNMNRNFFQDLQKHSEWGSFFSSFVHLMDMKDSRIMPYRPSRWKDSENELAPREIVMGSKIAEGGQAEIYEAWEHRDKYVLSGSRDFVLKVFKREYLLQDLQKQWPLGILQEGFDHVVGAMLLKDGRFAFILPKFWGDLRKLIDIRMQAKNNQGPPFSLEVTVQIMYWIALGMNKLHNTGIVHRDLKASNILMMDIDDADLDFKAIDRYSCHEELVGLGENHSFVVADFECSIGVMGTSFWRAPEILEVLRKKGKLIPELFTTKIDVYSYAMVCYEVVTGHIPFEGHRSTNYDLVLNGGRPLLPSDMDFRMKELIMKCWHQNPEDRPTFADIIQVLEELGPTPDSQFRMCNFVSSLKDKRKEELQPSNSVSSLKKKKKEEELQRSRGWWKKKNKLQPSRGWRKSRWRPESGQSGRKRGNLLTYSFMRYLLFNPAQRVQCSSLSR